LYNTNKNLTFAGAVRNMGNNLAIYKEAFPLPLTYSCGVSYYFKQLNIGLDFDQEINCDAVYKTGFEYSLSKNVDLRAGYIYSAETYANPGITAGLGFNVSARLYIDYAFVPYGDLGDTHRFSLKYNF
jgi:opacity protein-like surface antigen